MSKCLTTYECKQIDLKYIFSLYVKTLLWFSWPICLSLIKDYHTMMFNLAKGLDNITYTFATFDTSEFFFLVWQQNYRPIFYPGPWFNCHHHRHLHVHRHLATHQVHRRKVNTNSINVIAHNFVKKAILPVNRMAHTQNEKNENKNFFWLSLGNKFKIYFCFCLACLSHTVFKQILFLLLPAKTNKHVNKSSFVSVLFIDCRQ